MIDSEKIIKHMIAQYCDQQFKFTINLKILGSIHVIVDNNEVLTCLLDEKYFKPNVNRGLIIPNNSYTPSGALPVLTNPNPNLTATEHAINLVNHLSQLQQQQQQRCQKMSVSTVTSKSSSKSSTGSHSSSSSASSSSSYISSVLTDQSNQELLNANTKQSKRKRFTPKSGKNGINDDAASTGSSKKDSTENGSDNEHDNVSDVDEAHGHINEQASNHVSSSLASNMHRMSTNDTHEDAMDELAVHEADYLDASQMDQTPLKRNKLDTDFEGIPIESVTSNSMCLSVWIRLTWWMYFIVKLTKYRRSAFFGSILCKHNSCINTLFN